MPRRKPNRPTNNLPHNQDTHMASPLDSHHQFFLTERDFNFGEDPMTETADLRQELSVFFLTPLERWRIAGEVPYVIIVQVLKVIIVTTQLILFGSLSSARVSYGERVALSFKHAFLLDWDPQYETLPYPPSTGVYAVYTRSRFYESIGFALREFNDTESSSLNGYTFTDINRTVEICVEQFQPLSMEPKGATGDSNLETVCKELQLVSISRGELATAQLVKHCLMSRGIELDFARFRKLEIDFRLNSPPIHHADWDMSIECFQFDIRITFDDSGQTGQVVVLLQSKPVELNCTQMFPELRRHQRHPEKAGSSSSSSALRQTLHLIINLLAFNASLLSLGLCAWSVVQSIFLLNKTRHFFVKHSGIRLRGVVWDFLSPWHLVTILSDLLIVAGSTFKLVHNKNILEAYSEWSFLLGMGTLLIWISLLRFAKISSHTDILLNTIKRAVPGLLRFCVCALILYFAFALSAWVIIGPFHMKFRTFTSTLECLFSLINGDDMYVTFSIIGQDKGLSIFIFSRLFLYAFVTLFIYVVLNIFVTIIFEAYEEVKDMHGSPEAGGISRLNPLQQFLSDASSQPLPTAAAAKTHPAPPGGTAPGDGGGGGDVGGRSGEEPGPSFATLNRLSVSHSSSFTGSSTEFPSVEVMLDGSGGGRDRTPPQTDDDAQRLLDE